MTAAAKITDFATISDVPLTRIRESPFNKRSDADYGDLDEFAVGVELPGLARMVPADARGRDVELVFGHRRFRASAKFGFGTMRVELRELTDEAAQELQIIEHIRRDPHPLSEAASYDELRTKHQRSVDQIAARVGRSPKYVRGRLRLVELGEAGRKAFLDGRITLGPALVLVGLPDVETQDKVLDKLIGPKAWHGGEPPTTEDAVSAALELSRKLSEAVFDRKSETLFVEAGACTACAHNTDVSPDLFGDLEDPNKATCTKPACFREKERLHVQIGIDKAKNAGREVLSPAQSKKLFTKPSKYDGPSAKPHLKGDAGFVDLAEKCEADPKGRTFAQILNKPAKAEAVVAVDSMGKSHDLLPREKAKELLKSIGIKLAPKPSAGGSSHGSHEKQEAKRKHDQKIRQAVADELDALITAKIRASKPKLEDLLRLMVSEDSGWIPPEMQKHYGIKDFNKWVRVAPIADVARYQLERMQVTGGQLYGGYPDSFVAACKQHGLDLEAVEKKHRAIDGDSKRAAVAGTCRRCGCTETTPCAEGCAWTDQRETLCTACVDEDGNELPPLAKDEPAKPKKKRGGK